MISFFKRKWEEYNKPNDELSEMVKVKHIAHLMSSSKMPLSGNEILKAINTAKSYGYRQGLEKGVCTSFLVGLFIGFLLVMS